MSTERIQDNVFPAVDSLQVPPEFAAYEEATEPHTIVLLEQWKNKAYGVLSNLRDHLRSHQSLDIRTQAKVVYYAAAFDSDGPWSLELSRVVARDILSAYEHPNLELLERVLRDYVKPIFRPNPHPSLNVETGRKVPRTAGGPMGHLDYLEGQEWKSHPALPNVLSWCILHAETPSVEKLWHLFIPPIMTLLDDYQAKYKLKGVELVLQLLQVAPPDMLRRTGIDTLLFTSLKTCLTFLHNPETPNLIRTAVRASIRLTTLTMADGSSARFEQLCVLLGEGIIGNIWIYSSREPDALEASVDVIPDIVQVLGIGASRYLKGLIPQLVFPLVPAPDNGASDSYKRASLRALLEVMRACSPRIHKWRGTILEAILKCWVDLREQSEEGQESAALQQDLKAASALLVTVCQPVASTLEAEYQHVLALDPTLFGPLLRSPSVETS